MNQPFSLDSKNILITGASSGIGRAIAIQCSRQRANIILSGRNKIALSETLNLLEQGDHTSISCDLTRDADITLLSNSLPELDGIVLNAGIVKTLPIKYIKREAIENLFETNLFGSILLIQNLLKLKKIKKKASICFISSLSSKKVILGNSLYSASKSAINSFTKSLAQELAPKRIRVNAILPAFVETSILSKSTIDDEQLEKHKANFPLGRFGKPDDIAYLTLYLLSDASEWMTGSLIKIDGGYSLK